MNKRKDMDVKSSKVIGIRLTEEEHELLRERAFEHRTTISEYSRQAILRAMKENRVIWRQK